MTTSYGGTPPGITGTHYGGPSIGTLGADVPSTGEHGAGYLYAGLSLPADATVRVRGPITRWPTNGTLQVFEDSSFVYTGATDYAEFLLYQDGVQSTTNIGYGPGVGRFTLTIGTGLSGGIVLGDVLAAGSLSSSGAGDTFYRPTSDISATGWTAVPSGSLFSVLDEPSPPNDADYITSTLAGAVPAGMGIGPLPAGTYTLRVRASVTSGTGTLRVRLQDGAGVTLATSADQALTTTPTTYAVTMTISATASRVSIEVSP